jgi:rRNA maturation protein Nop10
MKQKEIDRRILDASMKGLAAVFGREKRPENMWWLSFCDPSLPKGKQFIGAVIVHARDFNEALTDCTIHECNPHGEVKGVPIPLGHPIDDKWKYRILKRKDIDQFDKEMLERMGHE